MFNEKELNLIKSFLNSSIQIPVSIAKEVANLIDKVEEELTKQSSIEAEQVTETPVQQ